MVRGFVEYDAASIQMPFILLSLLPCSVRKYAAK